MSLARAALPILPTGFAWFCFLLNFLLPGSGTATSGLLACCMGAPRFATIVTAEHRVLALIINLGVGVFQFLSVIFCLVGWCWSVAWGIILVKTAGKFNNNLLIDSFNFKFNYFFLKVFTSQRLSTFVSMNLSSNQQPQTVFKFDITPVTSTVH